MGTTLKVLISLVVASVGTLMIASSMLRLYVYFQMRPDYSIRYWGVVPGIMFGSLVLSPILFALCYRLLSRKSKHTISGNHGNGPVGI